MEKSFRNVSITDIINWIKTNPNRERKLVHNSEKKDIPYNLENIGLRNVETIILDPPNILSVIKYLEDPMFEITSISDRLSLVRNAVPDLIEKINNIKHNKLSRKRKRIVELLSNSVDNVPINTDDMKLLYEGLSFIKNLQFVLVSADPIINPLEGSEDYNKIIYFSSNPINWSKDNPVHIVDFRSKWIAKFSNSTNINIRSWLETLERNMWTIEWPYDDITKKEALEQLENTPIWKNEFRKFLKEDLTVVLGKHKTLETLQTLYTPLKV